MTRLAIAQEIADAYESHLGSDAPAHQFRGTLRSIVHRETTAAAAEPGEAEEDLPNEIPAMTAFPSDSDEEGTIGEQVTNDLATLAAEDAPDETEATAKPARKTAAAKTTAEAPAE